MIGSIIPRFVIASIAMVGAMLVGGVIPDMGAAAIAQVDHPQISVDPAQYGAVGDGIADDATALAHAFAAAAALRAPVVLRSSKTYLVSVELPLPAGLTIVGNGAAIKAKAGARIAGALLRGTGVSNVSIRTLEVDANATNAGANYGIWLTGGSGHVIEDVYVHDTAQGGILFEELTRSAIRGGRVVNCGRALGVGGGTATNNHGIMIFTNTDNSNVSDIEVSGVTIENAYRKGITTYSGSTGTVSNVTIRGNRIRNSGLPLSSGGGIYVANAPSGAVQSGLNILGNVLSGNYVNIEVANLRHGRMANNVATGSAASNIEINQVEDLSVMGNTISDSGVHGIACIAPSGRNRAITISGNTIRRSNRRAAGFGAGIWLLNTVESRVAGNTIDDRSAKMSHGIIEQGTSGHNVIKGNAVSNATSANYTLAGAITAFPVSPARVGGNAQGKP